VDPRLTGRLGRVDGVIDPLRFRRVVGRFATGITVVTAVVDGEHHAMTCNSLTSVSLEPLLVLFCAEKIARFHDVVMEAGEWAVSVLSTEQVKASRHFAHRGRRLDGQFDGFPWTAGPQTGAVVLDGSIASIEVRTVSTTDGGDHTVVLGEVLSVGLPNPAGQPLVYVDGRYQHLA